MAESVEIETSTFEKTAKGKLLTETPAYSAYNQTVPIFSEEKKLGSSTSLTLTLFGIAGSLFNFQLIWSNGSTW